VKVSFHNGVAMMNSTGALTSHACPRTHGAACLLADIRSGTHAVKPQLPYTPGTDGAGIVQDIGEGVTHVSVRSRWVACEAVPRRFIMLSCLWVGAVAQPGDKVFVAATFGSCSGTYAEFAVTEGADVHKVPSKMVSGGVGSELPTLLLFGFSHGGCTIVPVKQQAGRHWRAGVRCLCCACALT